ncbi:hypothetical protein [Bacillus bingmayongensis]|uniref:hypothetical protein n=1 Tax=Bacillus bingmayongensis TaxID=1150157 RepID=UPI0021AEB653|nr:hypothetical protein [Bacillus bingmayongensis]
MERVQELYQQFQEEMGWNHNDRRNEFQHSKKFLLYIHMLLTTEVTEVAEEFRTLFYKTAQLKRKVFLNMKHMLRRKKKSVKISVKSLWIL